MKYETRFKKHYDRFERRSRRRYSEWSKIVGSMPMNMVYRFVSGGQAVKWQIIGGKNSRFRQIRTAFFKLYKKEGENQ